MPGIATCVAMARSHTLDGELDLIVWSSLQQVRAITNGHIAHTPLLNIAYRPKEYPRRGVFPTDPWRGTMLTLMAVDLASI